MSYTVENLNAATRTQAIEMMEPLVEGALWVPAAAVDHRPFLEASAIADALVETILAADEDAQVKMFSAHPELAGREAIEGRMTQASTSEQSRLGLLSLTSADANRFSDLNKAYQHRFGHPFIIALHGVPDLGTLFEIFERRLASTPAEEHASTLKEIASVIRSRVDRTFGSHKNSQLDISPQNQE